MSSNEDASYTTYHFFFIWLWNLVSNFLSESISIFNFNVDNIMYTSTWSYKLKLKADR
jgi:hypothetical protein